MWRNETGAGLNAEKFRIDKWLWAARFFKTRSLATDAVENGRVQLNEVRIKPAKAVAVGDRLNIQIGRYQFVVEVLALSSKRGSAPDAQKLYRETDESRQAREAIAAQLRAQPQPFHYKGRPTKRDRREIERFKRGGMKFRRAFKQIDHETYFSLCSGSVMAGHARFIISDSHY